MPIRLLIIDSQPLVRLGIGAAVLEDPEIEIVGEAPNGAGGLRLFEETKPDVTIVELRLTDFCAAEDLGLFFTLNKDAKIIVRTNSAGDAELRSSLELGALGFLNSNASPEEVLNAIRTVAKGSSYLPSDLCIAVDAESHVERLTAAEKNVLRMMVGGMSNKEIAFALDISDNTVKTHVRHIFEKLGVNDRTTATVTAIRRGLVRVDV